MPAPFIVLEGIQGVGKTTLAKALAERLNGVFVKTPPDEQEEQRRVFMAKDPAPQACYEYFRGLIAQSSAFIRMYQANGTPVVSDLYWYSTVVINSTAGAQTAMYHFDGLAEPDLIVHLTTEESVRGRRLAERGSSVFPGKDIGNAWDNKNAPAERLSRKYQLLWQSFGANLPPVVEIDTSNLSSLEEVPTLIEAAGFAGVLAKH
jgi:dTMP kinase